MIFRKKTRMDFESGEFVKDSGELKSLTKFIVVRFVERNVLGTVLRSPVELDNRSKDYSKKGCVRGSRSLLNTW